MALIVTVDAYRTFTGDQTSTNEAVEAALQDSHDFVAEELARPLELLERTESLPVIEGRVYPTATPIVDAYYEIENQIALLGPFETNDWYFFDASNPKVSVTYTGGWTSVTLPYRLKEAICRIAYIQMNPVGFSSSVPTGAISIRNGDVSVGYGPKGANASSGSGLSSVLGSISRYRRRTP